MASVKKKPAAKKTIKAVARKKPIAQKPAAKAAAKKSIAKKLVSAKKPAQKKPVAKKTTAKKAPVRKPVAKPAVKQQDKAPRGIPELMRDAALKILDERQAEDIVAVNLAGRSSVADYMIIASGRAGRQVSAIADYLRQEFHKLGVKQIRIEGLAEANWVLIDAGDVIVHLFRPEVRSYYDLDAIWNSTRAVQR